MNTRGYWNGHYTDLAKAGEQNRKHKPKVKRPSPPTQTMRAAFENWRDREDAKTK